jgi:hypothetical protein
MERVVTDGHRPISKKQCFALGAAATLSRF